MGYKKVKLAKDNIVRKTARLIKDKAYFLFTFRNPQIMFYYYEVRDFIKPIMKYYQIIIPYLVALFAILLINSSPGVTMAPSETIGRVLNLINSCALLAFINVWHMILKGNKIPIFR